MVRTYASASCGGTATGRLTEKAPTNSRSTPERSELRTSAHRRLFGRAPSVCSACKLDDRRRCNSRPDLGLHVALDRRFRCTATFFTPHDRDLGARFAVFHVDTGQREHRALVVAITGVRRYPNQPSVFRDPVVWECCVVRQG